MIVLLAMMVCGIGAGFIAILVSAVSEDDGASDGICTPVTVGVCSTVPPAQYAGPARRVDPSIKASGVREVASAGPGTRSRSRAAIGM